MTGFTYAVGDIHGRFDLLLKAIEAIEAHGQGRHDRVVLLGDYIDRGPDSRGVVEFLIANAKRLRLVCLKGNHEAMLVEAARSGDAKLQAHWLQYGGLETMKSYGWTWRRTPDFSTIPREHIDWMADRPIMTRDQDRIFVHAGLEPDKALHHQEEAICLWIRDKFLEADLDKVGLHVVHGHTPEWSGKIEAAEPELLEHRTNLDTGAYYTGVLVVGVFAEDSPGGPMEVLRIESECGEEAIVARRWRRPRVSLGIEA